MKKAFLFKMFAIIFFSLALLALESETSVCKLACCPVLKSRLTHEIKKAGETKIYNTDIYNNYQAFFIKI